MIYCYPVHGKQKALDICRAFAQGCGGQVVEDAPHLMPGPAFFFGVDESIAHLWREVRSSAANEFYYCDNSYFDQTRQTYFRVTKNALQHSGKGESNCERFVQLGIPIVPRRYGGKHLVVCPQSDSFMQTVVGYKGDWGADTMKTLRGLTAREIHYRSWSGNKGKLAATLHDDLKDAYALVTWSSAAAITAILNGIPAFCSYQCAAAPVSAGPLQTHLPAPHFAAASVVRNWAGVLADNQWTLDEIRAGVAWRKLSA